MHWKRVFGWSFVIIIAANVLGLLSGLILGNSEIREETIGRLIELHRIGRTIAIGTVSAFCYWRLGAGVAHKALNILAAFLLVQLLDIAVAYLMGASIGELLDIWPSVRGLLYAAIGYFFARLRPNNSFKPRPLRGSA